MWALRAVVFSAIFYVATFCYSLAGILVSPFSRRATIAVVHGWARFHAGLADRLVDIRTQLVGRIPLEPCLIAVKHQATYETVEMLRLAHLPVMVMKKELSDIPLFGWMTRRYGAIVVERSAGARALKAMVKEAKTAIATGRPVVIFPEGTRVRPGSQPPLQSGFAGLYRVLGLPVVPIALDSGRHWIGVRALNPGTITFKVGESIPPGLNRDDIEERVHRAINALETTTGSGT